jgi:transcriptional regulator EpsA
MIAARDVPDRVARCFERIADEFELPAEARRKEASAALAGSLFMPRVHESQGGKVETNTQRIADARNLHRFRGARVRKNLQSFESKIESAIETRVRRVRRSGSRKRDMGSDNDIDFLALGTGRTMFPLSAHESDRFLRIASSAQLIQRHYQLFQWLSGEIQKFLPHEILISAWGDFAKGELKLDVVSAIPGVRTEELTRNSIDALVRICGAAWVAGARRPQIIKAASLLETIGSGKGPLYSALRGMRSVVIHGIRDLRGGHDSLYIVLNSGSITKGRAKDQFTYLMDSLIGQIDLAFRRVAALPIASAKSVDEYGDWLELSAREHEILDWLVQGKTNVDIAAALDISPFTVKNHVQRIFKKIGVNNRTQAAAKYSHALRELREYLERSPIGR